MKHLRHWLLPTYLSALMLIIAVWFYVWGDELPGALDGVDLFNLLAIVGVYGLSHLFRMVRLALLTLDSREQVLPLLSCHAITAFPSALLPLKMGEVLRLGSFVYALKPRKALAIWLAERFGDISVIALFILVLYFFNVEIPQQLRMIFVLFLAFSLLALTAFFAVAKVFVYLSRYLVLSSHSPHGLQLLKLSHHLRLLESAILDCFTGRFLSIALVSVLVWVCEIGSIALFIRTAGIDVQALSQFFLAGLSGVLEGDSSTTGLDIYRDFVLIALSLFFGAILTFGRLISSQQRQKKR